MRKLGLNGFVVNLDGGVDVGPDKPDSVIAPVVDFGHKVSESYVFRAEVVVDKNFASILYRIQYNFKELLITHLQYFFAPK